MIIRVRGALSGASLSAAAQLDHRACIQVCVAARASRTKSEISCRPGKFLCFDLDSTPHLLRRVKAQALRGNKKFPACRSLFGSKLSLPPNNPRLEVRLPDCQHCRDAHVGTALGEVGVRSYRRMCSYICILQRKSGLDFSSSCAWEQGATLSVQNIASLFLPPRRLYAYMQSEIFRSRYGKALAVVVILGFIRRMCRAVSEGSKLSALITRPWIRPGAVSMEQLGKGDLNPPLHPPCRCWRHAETVPVSAPFGLHGELFDWPAWAVLP